jgi:hypothetical protein
MESVMSQYCGWQSRAGVVRYLKFREPYTIEPAACPHANKTGMLVINKKSYAVQMGAVRSYTDFTEGRLDLNHTHEGVGIDPQVTQTVGSVRQDGVGMSERGVGDDNYHFRPLHTCDGQEHDRHPGWDLHFGVLAGRLP